MSSFSSCLSASFRFPSFVVHLISLASQIWFNMCFAVDLRLVRVLVWHSDALSALRLSSLFEPQILPRLELLIHRLVNSSSYRLRLPHSPFYLLPPNQLPFEPLFSILQPLIYLVLTQLRFFSPTSFRISFQCFACVQQHARACYYRLVSIARIQTVAQRVRSFKAIRTSTSNCPSPLIDPGDRSIQHSHPTGSSALSQLFFCPLFRSPLFLRSLGSTSSRPNSSFLSDYAVSQHTQLSHIHSDDFLDGPHRRRRHWLAMAFRARTVRHADVFDALDDELPPLDPSWL